MHPHHSLKTSLPSTIRSFLSAPVLEAALAIFSGKTWGLEAKIEMHVCWPLGIISSRASQKTALGNRSAIHTHTYMHTLTAILILYLFLHLSAYIKNHEFTLITQIPIQILQGLFLFSFPTYNSILRWREALPLMCLLIWSVLLFAKISHSAARSPLHHLGSDMLWQAAPLCGCPAYSAQALPSHASLSPLVTALLKLLGSQILH